MKSKVRVSPKGWCTSYGLTNANLGSHEVKSACQPKGWRTSYGLTNANLGSHEVNRACRS